jgi:Mg2+-importing ATPase
VDHLSYQEAAREDIGKLKELLSVSANGLTKEEVEERTRKFGPNASRSQAVSPWEIFVRQFRSAFVYLLFFASVIALFLAEYADAALIFAFLLVNAGLGFFQEYRAERSLELLNRFVERSTRVRREGVETLVPVREVVPGDLVILEAGDMIPADGRFVRAESVTVDESVLTGESVPAEKTSDVVLRANDYSHARNIGFARTTLLSGEAELLVFATGDRSQVGDIAKRIAEAESPSAFSEGIGKFSTFILKLILGTIPLIFLLNALVHGDSLDYGEFLLFSIALTVSVIPEALPLVATISMSQGALHLARRQVVPRRLSAIEDLGSIEVLCTDKTGTITENRLSVAEIFGDLKETLSYALAPAVLAPTTRGAQNSVYNDAILRHSPQETIEYAKTSELLDELPFDPVRRRSSILFRRSGRVILVSRGAPEVLVNGTRPDAMEWAREEGKKGRRVLAVAHYDFGMDGPTSISPEVEAKAGFVGIVSFSDPLKQSTRDALKKAEGLGVRIKIITGDAPEVAGWIGKEAGIISDPTDVLLGETFEAMSENERETAVRTYDVFARTSPAQKFEIIRTIGRSQIVGFLGEGFNDAPALKAAHVGLAVSGASDIAQDASDLVLLNSSLEVIVDGIREGRMIFANSMKYLRATLTSNFGNFYALALSTLFIPFLPMLPIQVLLLNLLSDFPMISIASDSVDEREVRRPQKYDVRDITGIAIVLGIISTIFDFAFFGFFARFGDPAVLQTMWFIGSVLTELVLLFSIRTMLPFWRVKRPSRIVLVLTASAAFLTITFPFIPVTRELFGFARPEAWQLAVVFGLVALYLVSTETAKLFYVRYWGKWRDPVTAR